MMGDIYQNASIVRAWLGPETDNSLEAFKLLRCFKRSFGAGDKLKRAYRLDENERRALTEFANLSYWSGDWTVQEVVLAQEIVFHWGEEDMVWWPLLLTSLRLSQLFDSPAGLILSPRNRRRRNTLMNLMRNCYASQATDVRDKIYALLGIADDTSPDTMPVDYNIGIQGLQQQVDDKYRSQELRAAPQLWQSLGHRLLSEDTCELQLRFSSRYSSAYFHHPGVFALVEETRRLATPTSYNTPLVKRKLGLLLFEFERIEKLDARRVDSGIVMVD